MNSRYIQLSPLTKSERFQYAVWDIEAANWWDLTMIGFYDGKQYVHFRTIEDFLNYVLQRKYRHWRIFAHFGGRYDMNFLFDNIRSNPDYKMYFFFSGSMAIKMTIEYKDITLYFCDSYRLLNAPLRQLCEAFGVKHQKQKIDYFNIVYCKELIEYNRNDCMGLHEVLESFFEQTGIRSETFATHSLRVWRKDFLKRNIFMPKEYICDFARRAYVGGRVEVFKRESNNVNAYDVNSMYPYAMKKKIPVDYSHHSKRLELNDNTLGFVEAIVEIPPNIYIPPLPIRLEKLYFTSGIIQGVWTSEELSLAEKLGVKIQRIVKALYFRCDKIFDEYVDKLFHLKRHSEEPTRTISKYLLNSLYGKFGQNPVKKVYCRIQDAPEGSSILLDSNGQPTGFCYYETISKSAYLLPHISAAITSSARIHLLASLNSNSFYCDTDSIFTTDTMPTGKNLGEWSNIGNGNARFLQPKLYRFNGDWKGKGISVEKPPNYDSFTKQQKQELFNKEVEKFISGEGNIQRRHRSIKEALKGEHKACSTVEITKVLRAYRPKRRWINDQDTEPWNITELM